MPEVPVDLAIERAVLGAVMTHPTLFRRLDVPAEAFFGELHRTIYLAMNDLDEDGLAPDLKVVNSKLVERGVHRPVELAEMVDGYNRAANFDSYVEKLRRVAFRRAMFAIEDDCLAEIANPEADHEAIEVSRAARLRRARETFWPASTGQDADEEWRRLRDFYGDSQMLQITTGIRGLDRVIGDLYPQSVCTILARPGVGKSVLGLNLVANWLRLPADWGVMFVSLEMGDTLATDRLVRILEGWGKDEIRQAALSGRAPEEFLRLTRDRYLLFPHARQSLASIERVKDAWERQHGRRIRAVIIDYFQYLAGEPTESPYVKSSRLSREIKELAKVGDCVVINLCQVSRGEAGGQVTKCPAIDGARDSGTIEENADVLLGMWRPDPDASRLFVKGLKVRQGTPGDQCELAFDPQSMRLRDADESAR